MESLRYLFVMFGALVIWTFKGFKGQYVDLIQDDENYLHFFIGLGTSLTLVVVIGRFVIMPG